MTPVNVTVARIIAEQGRTQTWLVKKMNEMNPCLNLDTTKFSAIVTGKRTMTGDELIAFCGVLNVTPDEFMK